MRAGSIPAVTNSSSSIARSSKESEFASLFVPNTASPQFRASNHLQCAMNRFRSGDRSARNGVTTGAKTPRMRLVMISCNTQSHLQPETLNIQPPTIQLARQCDRWRQHAAYSIGFPDQNLEGIFQPSFLNYQPRDRKSTRLNSSHVEISYAVFCLKKKRYGESFVAARAGASRLASACWSLAPRP